MMILMQQSTETQWGKFLVDLKEALKKIKKERNWTRKNQRIPD